MFSAAKQVYKPHRLTLTPAGLSLHLPLAQPQLHTPLPQAGMEVPKEHFGQRRCRPATGKTTAEEPPIRFSPPLVPALKDPCPSPPTTSRNAGCTCALMSGTPSEFISPTGVAPFFYCLLHSIREKPCTEFPATFSYVWRDFNLIDYSLHNNLL